MKKTYTSPRRGIDRRTVLKGAAAAAAVGTGVTGFPAYLKAANTPIKIGMPTILSGRVAILGELLRSRRQQRNPQDQRGRRHRGAHPRTGYP
ncbi:MAG: twin-arginine translocation signal domain-containing protein [Thalassobaculum sp.]